MNKVTERFLQYISYDTQSDPCSKTTPSTKKQLALSELIKEELVEIGLKDVSLDSNGYLTATLPSNAGKKLPVVGFIAHVDTSPDFTGLNVKPKITENYQGGAIALNEEFVLSPKEFPELLDYIGADIISTSGDTLLGADDKAGVAEIVTAMEYLIQHPEIKHGEIKICFTPDEEIGAGADHFQVKEFGADFAYTLDGGGIGELEYENFNAAFARIKIKGKNVHPGTAKNIMINSMKVANEFISAVPDHEAPEHTQDYEGFYHLISIKGEVEETTFSYLIRDFNKEKFEKRKEFVLALGNFLNKKYGVDLVSIDIKDQYYNMREKIEPVYHIVDLAEKAMKECNIAPKVIPIRGGTDGARLSYMGLPCPNIFAGGHNFHGRFEYVPVQSMNKAVEVVVKIAEIIGKG